MKNKRPKEKNESEIMNFVARAEAVANYLIAKFQNNIDDIKAAADQIQDEELRREVLWHIGWFEAMPQCWLKQTAGLN